MPVVPPDAPGSGRRSAGALSALIVLSIVAIPVFLYHGFLALLLTEPPECFMQLTPMAQAQCEQAKAEGWSLLPSVLLGFLALLPLLAVLAAWVWRRHVAMRWTALGVIAAAAVLGLLVPG